MTASTIPSIGIDFGGTSIKLGVVRGTEVIAHAPSIATQEYGSPDQLIEAIAVCEHAAPEPPGGAGHRHGDARIRQFLPRHRLYAHQRSRLEQRSGQGRCSRLPADCRFMWRTTPNCMAYAEWKLGAGRGMRHLVCLTLGTGVGSGLIVNGDLLRGATCSAGELGQTSIDYRGRLGHYSPRSLEDYVGNREIAADARTLYASHGIDKAIVDCNPIALGARRWPGTVAAQVWRDLAVKLSCALMNCCYLLNPEAIIIGGGGGQTKTLLFEPLQEIMRTQLAAPLAESLTILPAQFGTEAGILGSAHLALNTHFGETFRV